MTQPPIPRNVLCLDIGSGTQDVLYYRAGSELENCPKFVLPAPARQVGARLRALTAARQAVHLHGWNMGGGFYRDVKAHLEAGLAVSAHPNAAYSLGDDLERIQSMGVTLSSRPHAGHVPVLLADFDAGWWQGWLAMAGLPPPDLVTACAQDHGFHPGASNRLGRFTLWQRFLLEHEGQPHKLLFLDPPSEMTRLQALQAQIGGGPVSDTGAAAVLGLLAQPEIALQSHSQCLLCINIGNSHTIAFLVYKERIWGVYEHHTGIHAPQELWDELHTFATGKLCSEKVFEGRGHGCLTLDIPSAVKEYCKPYVIGPRRELLAGYAADFPSPGGDMMLTGCFGLVHGLRLHGLA